jgi:hypothetical protein
MIGYLLHPIPPVKSKEKRKESSIQFSTFTALKSEWIQSLS